MFQILLVSALCLDAFSASFAYGVSRTKIPPAAVIVISVVCTGILAASAGLGGAAKSIIPPAVGTIVSFALLLIIGLVKCFEFSLKRFIAKKSENRLNMKLFDLHIVLTVYADTDKADLDNSKTLSVRESFYLALALSLDGFAAGFGWGLAHAGSLTLIVLSLLSNLLAVTLGCLLGRLLTNMTKLDLSWVGGVLLIVLAVSKLLF
ncbi:manganese efflux pump [Oscillospiraceae bacterium CM]|nr:manganese efflux pump [Oscillospiraceae bacterium CM]